jgi:hypothetical protein
MSQYTSQIAVATKINAIRYWPMPKRNQRTTLQKVPIKEEIKFERAEKIESMIQANPG